MTEEISVENFQPENNYRCHRILLDLGDKEPPIDLLQKPDPVKVHEYPKTPYMLIRATAFQWIDQIRNELKSVGISVTEELSVPQFETYLRHIYPINPNEENSYIWLYLSRVFLGKDMANMGYAFILDENHLSEYGLVDQAKRSIRKFIGITPFRLRYQGRIIDTDLHHIHAPDFNDIQYEYSLLRSYLTVTSKNG